MRDCDSQRHVGGDVMGRALPITLTGAVAIALAGCEPNTSTALGLSVTLNAVTDSIKTAQAFEIYIGGQYSVWEDCSPEVAVTLARDSFRYDHTVCKVNGLLMSDEPYGFQLNLTNCKSDNGAEPDNTVVISTGKLKQIHGWADDPIDIYQCEFK